MARPRTPVGAWGDITTVQLGERNEIIVNATGERLRQPRAGENLMWKARARFRNDLGQQVYVSRFRKSKLAAETALREALTAVKTTTSKDLTQDSTIRELTKRWLDVKEKEDLAARTKQSYRERTEQHILSPVYGIGDLALREATTERLQRFLDSLVKENKGKGTAKHIKSLLSGMFGYAVRMDALKTNPARELRALAPTGEKATTAYTQKEIVQILTQVQKDEWCQQHDLPDLIAFLAGTGVRIGEALALLWDDVDLEVGTITIHANLVRVAERGLIRQPHTKTRDVRVLPLPKSLLALMLNRRLKNMPNKVGAVFPSSTGTYLDTRNVISRWKTACERLNLPYKSTHAFRKAVATTIDLGGLGARAAAEQLGHKDPAMTQRVYMSKTVGDARTAETLEKHYPKLQNSKRGVNGE